MKKLALVVAAGAATAVTGTAVATAASSSTDAVRAVQTASKGVSHKAYELDRERGRWEVTFADGTERHVTLDGRRVTATRRGDDRSAAAASARVSLASALKTAGARVRATVDDADLDREGGRLVWTVSFGETEVEVDARSGRVVQVTRDGD